MRKFQVSIPKPCHENWHLMSVVQKDRFCASCQKIVIDFTKINDSQLADYFKRPSTPSCGRFHIDQLNRDIAGERTKKSWINYLFRIAIPAFLLGLKANAQIGKPHVTGDTVVMPSKPIPREAPITITRQVKGTVVDAEGAPIAGVSIQVKGSDQYCATNKRGEFSLNAPPHSWLFLTAVGFTSKQLQLDSTNQNLQISLDPQIVVIAGELIITCRPASTPMPLLKKISDTVRGIFTIYPNPAQSMANIKIGTGKLEKGNYIISVIDMSGEVLQTEDVKINRVSHELQIRLNNMVAGTYLVHVFNRKTATSFTEQLVVQ